MSRNPILDDTVARLMAERFAGPRRPEYGNARPPPPIYEDEALENARRLLEAITDDDNHAWGP